MFMLQLFFDNLGDVLHDLGDLQHAKQYQEGP